MPPVRRLVRRSFLDRRLVRRSLGVGGSLGEGGSEGGSLLGLRSLGEVGGEVGSVVKISVLENESTFSKRSMPRFAWDAPVLRRIS